MVQRLSQNAGLPDDEETAHVLRALLDPSGAGSDALGVDIQVGLLNNTWGPSNTNNTRS